MSSTSGIITSDQHEGKPFMLSNCLSKLCWCCLKASVSTVYASFSPFSFRRSVASCQPIEEFVVKPLFLVNTVFLNHCKS